MKKKEESNSVLKNEEKEAETLETLSLDEEEMKRLSDLGLPVAGFETTKGAQGDDASVMSSSRLKSRRQYRQYMNRRGGFNRPLAQSY